MPAASRLTDIWVGICCCHNDPTCIGMSGPIITASSNAAAGNLMQSRLLDLTMGSCGHTGNIVSASPTVYANGRGKARIGSVVTGCNIGTVVTGHGPKEIGSGAATRISTKITFQDQVIEFTEVDYGNLDDDEDTDDGLNIFPGTDNPTPQQIARSEELDVSPTTEVAEDSTASDTSTPTITCTDIGDVADPDYQLSTNFQLKELSTQAVISHYYVREQHGLSVSDIVCNLQAVAQFILEPLVTAYGKANFIITSAFRHGSSTSQHERGQAADIQFPLYTNQQVYDIAVWIKNNLNYDQLILEYGGNRPWIHCSFNRAGNRSDAASNKFGTRISAGNYVWGTIKYMT
jgi:uncharacterized protein YcbK (DUF882 family)